MKKVINVVEDEKGNKSVYKPVEIKTSKEEEKPEE